MSTTVNQMSAAIEDLLINPARAQQFSLSLLEKISNGEQIVVDPTNPFVFLLEASTANAAAALNKTEKLMRNMYPSLANTYEQLYHHMSDKDYLNRFGTPARTTLTLMLGLDEVKQKAVKETSSGVKRLTIPRFTRFSVANTPFTLLYPIDIRLMRHGGFRITYNDDYPLEVETLSTNLVEWTITSMYGSEWLTIDIPIQQLDIVRKNAQINRATGFTKTYELNDDFHYCEAYNLVDNQWRRIRVSHSELVHNAATPTITLKVKGQTVTVDVPQIYLNNQSIKDTVRLDFYTTKGKLELDLAGYAMSSFEAKWNPVNNETIDQYSSPLETFNSIGMYSGASTYGGAPGLSFSEMRHRVVNRTTVTEGLPITGKQLNAKLRDLGFELIKNIDDVTNRQFLATRNLPPPTDGRTISGMGATVKTLVTAITTLRQHDSVIDNGNRTTIKPSVLYQLDNGILNVVDDQATQALSTMTVNRLVDQLNTQAYLFSPFHYVIDTDDSMLDCRIYNLQTPKILTRFFFQQNLTVGSKFDIKAYHIRAGEDFDGYVVEIEADMGETLKAMQASDLDIQLSFKAHNALNRYFVKGKLISPLNDKGGAVGGIYIWQFKIQSRYDINKQDQLYLMPFFAPVELTHEFDVTTVVKNYLPTDYEVSDLDDIVDDAYLHGGQYIAVTQEKIKINFGSRLEQLYNRTRTVVDAEGILTRDNDEPMVYDQDVYKYDDTGNIEFSYDPVSNTITTTLLHKKGEVVLDQNNAPLYKWRKGDVVLDHLGKPIYKDGGAGLKREIDLFLLDARYKYATTNSARTYLERITTLVSDWVNTDMRQVGGSLLERSEIFYHPTITQGLITVKADNNKLISVDTQQKFVVTYFMNADKFDNAVLREAVKLSTVKTLYEGLQSTTVTKDALLRALLNTTERDVVSVDIQGFLRDEWRAATLIDTAQRLTLDKRVVVKSNGEIDVEDNIDVRFMLHTN